MKTLLQVKNYEQVMIHHIHHEPSIKRRLMDLGFVENVMVIPVLNSPSKGMRAYLVKGCKIALRDSESKGIIVCDEGDEHVV